MNSCPYCFAFLDSDYNKCPYCFQNLKDDLEDKSPSFFKKAQNFTTSVVNYVSSGMVNVSDPIKQERMAICRACPFFNSSNTTCNKCGCFLEIKTGWASEKCPEGKWDEVKTQSSGGCGCNKS